ncbi:MAG: YibE/F family protein [Chloroflexi bacterium]|nr:YibE/F family protein [Chloroflexota bacterium]
MKQFKWQIILIVAAVVFFFAWPYFNAVELPGDGFSTFGSDTVRAEVTQIIEEGEVDMGGRIQTYQIARVNILEGDYAGIIMEIDYGKRQVRSDDYLLAPGDRIVVSISKTPENVINAYFVDYVRTTPILWLTGIFAVSIILISRWKGVRALLSTMFSLYIIIGYIIPHILTGEDPLTVSIIGSIILLGVTLYLTYGWTLKTHAAVISMILILLLTGALSALFVTFAKLNGTGDENVMFLMQMMQTPINLRGLLLGGMIIGALGVLDDLVTTQASAVFELHHANANFKFRDLYNSAMRIGQDHVAATVNTLVLAYAGASLPMLLMFSLAHGDYGYLVNFSFIAEEIVRTLVGSLGLIAAVPLTTTIAIFLATRAESLGKWEQFLGPEGSGGHSH